jgi:lactoylglutathione lyase
VNERRYIEVFPEKARPAAQEYPCPLEIRTGTNRKRPMNLCDPGGTRLELREPHTVDGKPAASSTAAAAR